MQLLLAAATTALVLYYCSTAARALLGTQLTLNFLSVPSICTSCLPTTLARPSKSSAPDLQAT